MNIVKQKAAFRALSETNPDRREISESGKRAMKEICDYWIIEFAKWVHQEQQKTGERNKVYAKDINAAFATFIMRGADGL